MRRLLQQAAEMPGGLVVAEDMLASFVEESGDAAAFYRRFHWGEEPEVMTRGDAPRALSGEVLPVLGDLAEVAYDATKGGGDTFRWVHTFESPRPVLAYNRSGLIIVGGSYRVGRRGIVG